MTTVWSELGARQPAGLTHHCHCAIPVHLLFWLKATTNQNSARLARKCSPSQGLHHSTFDSGKNVLIDLVDNHSVQVIWQLGKVGKITELFKQHIFTWTFEILGGRLVKASRRKPTRKTHVDNWVQRKMGNQIAYNLERSPIKVSCLKREREGLQKKCNIFQIHPQIR